jgi:hypothetical protein
VNSNSEKFICASPDIEIKLQCRDLLHGNVMNDCRNKIIGKEKAKRKGS